MMSRKKFIESQGATCKNWRWSWSFVNHAKKIVIFGAWDVNIQSNGIDTLILSEEWRTNEKGRESPTVKQSLEHIRLVEEEGYILMTFPIKYSGAYKDKNGIGPAKIAGFTPKLERKYLKRVSGKWYASDENTDIQIAEEIDDDEALIEGASKTISVNVFERNAIARSKCLAHYGYRCIVCSFDFEEFYGSIGQNFIHVHHIVPLSEIRGEYELDPIKDLVPICPNCHAMIHRTHPILTLAQLREHLKTINA